MNTADTNALADIYYQSRIVTFDWINPNEVKLDDFHRDTKGEKIWVAELKGHVVGFVSFWEVEGFIHHLFVLPDYVSQGIGSQLLATCLNQMSKLATLKCVSANTNALSFYKKKIGEPLILEPVMGLSIKLCSLWLLSSDSNIFCFY